MSSLLHKVENSDRKIWDNCASVYEERIVSGHPNVTAYEAFEEDFLDALLIHLGRDCGRTMQLYDFGCGSGRLHLRYALKSIDLQDHPRGVQRAVQAARANRPDYAYCPVFNKRLIHISGVDFSARMISLAREKLASSGLSKLEPCFFSFDLGSALNVPPYRGKATPVAVSVCNSIGVMQGPAGARMLFDSMRKYVQKRRGIAVISAYRKDALLSFGLGNYESTLNVSGQPSWLTPKTYASGVNTLLPRSYKTAFDPSANILVDVYDARHRLVAAGVNLKRNPKDVAATLSSGRITTGTGYTSNWYSVRQFKEWIRDCWPRGSSYHIEGRRLDVLRGRPAQLAILDGTGALKGFFSRWGIPCS
ncbi:MAG: class I SAM-dependent methyltransferase [Fibrobacterota bacterium]